MKDDRPPGLVVPLIRKSTKIYRLLKLVPRDGQWHRVDEPYGGSTAAQYARRLNIALESAAIDVSWVFGYRDLGDQSELWAKYIGTQPDGAMT